MNFSDFDEDKEWQMSDAEHDSVIKLSPKERYEHLIKRCADSEYIWSLKNADGWVLQKDDKGRECVPVWPHSAYARDCATGEWDGAVPEAIDLDDWIDAWLPGMEKDGRLIVVFPIPGGNSSAVEAAKMAEDLLDELEQFELDE